MVRLLNKLQAPVEFCHGGEVLKCLPGVEVECSAEMFAALNKYPAAAAYFGSAVDVKADEPKAPAKKGK